ncbi:MAG: hypothetical protein B6229_01890, partial [Spirochaetaceae bacterium 4572_7]
MLSFLNILILLLLATVIFLFIFVVRQRQIIFQLKQENASLTQSKESSLEYIDALWESQQEIIQEEK